MTSHNHPHIGYGVEAHTHETGWVLLDGMYRHPAAASKVRQSLVGKHGFTADSLRVVGLGITTFTIPCEPEGDEA